MIRREGSLSLYDCLSNKNNRMVIYPARTRAALYCVMLRRVPKKSFAAVVMLHPYLAGLNMSRTQKRNHERPMDQPIRILLAKVGLDGHDRGVKVVARTLRDAGMDVVYTGLHRTPEEVVAAAVQEDVDVLGVSLLSGVQLTVFPKILKLLREQGADDMIVVAGGVMPDDDVRELKKMGVREVLLQDTPPQAIVETLQRLVRERGAH